MSGRTKEQIREDAQRQKEAAALSCGVCPSGGKRSYATVEKAERALALMPHWRGKTGRAYRCQCGLWHLTAREQWLPPTERVRRA